MHQALVASLISSALRAPAALLAGVAAGRLAARTLRARGQHWSWALLAAAPLPLVSVLSPEALLAAAVAALVAARRGHRWHRQDVETGGLAARAAGDRRTPLDALERLRASAAVRSALCRQTPPSAPAELPVARESGGLLLGHDRRGRRVHVPLAGPSGCHALVVGATGSGKTVTEARLATEAAAQGAAVVAIDPKGDDALRAALCEAARRRGCAFLEWTPDGPLVYNPLARGGDTEIADKSIAGEHYSEPHYLRQAQRYLGHAVRALRAAGEPVSLAVLVRYMDPVELEVLGRELPAGAALPLQRYLDGLQARQRRDLAGTRDRLAALAESDAGRWLDPAHGASFDLLDVVQDGAVSYFRLDSDRHPLLASMLGASLVQDLLTTTAARQGDPRPTIVVIDEFAAIAAVHITRLFGRSRSAGFSVVLGTQELADLRAAGGGALLEQVLGNLTAVVAHRQVVPESAELLARLAGTAPGWIDSERLTRGRVVGRTRHPADLPLLAVEEMSALPTGHAALLMPGEPERGRLIRVLASEH
jgi:hypothetical protein